VEKSRIAELLERVGIEPIEFANALDVSKEYVYMLRDGARPVSKKLANKIENEFNIKREYLLGETDNFDEAYFGDNLSRQWNSTPGSNIPTVINETKTKLPKKQKNKVPFYDLDVTATITGSYLDLGEKPEYYVDLKPFNDCDAYVRVYGDSMYPKYQSGDIIAIKKINNLGYMRWGHVHLVVSDSYYDDLRTLKEVHPCEDDPECIILKSSNPNFKGENKVEKKHIIGLFLVKGKVRQDYM